MSKDNDINAAVTAHKKKIDALDHAFVGDSIGAYQALDDVRKALDDIQAKLDQREYEAAAQAGYQDIASAFIFLQRTLGGLSHLEGQKQALISEIGLEAGVKVYEEIEPYVLAEMPSSKPKPD